MESIYDMTFYLQEEGGCYRRTKETHVQHAYTLAEVREAVKQTGMVSAAAMDAKTEGTPTSEDE